MAWDVIIIGAGAAGMMCAIEAGKRSRSVLMLDHSKSIGEKIRISGGGRCNFTNIYASPANYISHNPRFCVSALSRYTQHDFIELVKKHGIEFHEKTLGQLFCNSSSKDIIGMLLNECKEANVTIQSDTAVKEIYKKGDDFELVIKNAGTFTAKSVVIATGGLSIPKLGATQWGHEIAKKFGHSIIPLRPGLVPFTLDENVLTDIKELAGVSLDVIASCNNVSFREGMVFTHRGLSGPSILQISSYWNKGDSININLKPDINLLEQLKYCRQTSPKQDIQTILTQWLPKRVVQYMCLRNGFGGKIADLSNAKLQAIADAFTQWKIVPSDTEGYRTAEVTIGGVNTDELSSKTMESKKVKGLYFIGEVVDVTGHLGGYNFQWAWSSGYTAGQFV